jgi:WD40 repeat protein
VACVRLLTLRNGVHHCVSAGLDGVLCAARTDMWQPSLRGRAPGQASPAPLLTLSYSPEWNMIVTGGADRVVRLWDDASLAQLQACHGHTAPVISVLCNGADGQIVSTARNQVLKVWDIFSYKCVQSVHDNSIHYPESALCAACLDPARRRVVTVGSNICVWMQDTRPELLLRERDVDNAPTHVAAVVALCYSSEFGQMVSVDEQGIVKVWEGLRQTERDTAASDAPECPVMVFDVGDTHTRGGIVNALPITAARMDLRERRLVTGAHDGSIWIWNYNTGTPLCAVGCQTVSVHSGSHTLRAGGGGGSSDAATPVDDEASVTTSAADVTTRAEVASLSYVTWNGSVSGANDVLIASGWQGALSMWGDYETEDLVAAGSGSGGGRGGSGAGGGGGSRMLPHCMLLGHRGDVTATAVCGTMFVSASSHGELLVWPVVKLSPGQIVKARRGDPALVRTRHLVLRVFVCLPSPALPSNSRGRQQLLSLITSCGDDEFTPCGRAAGGVSRSGPRIACIPWARRYLLCVTSRRPACCLSARMMARCFSCRCTAAPSGIPLLVGCLRP